jgi:predicted HTH domain antitoxin
MGRTVEEALRLLRENKITVWKAAGLTGVSYREMLRLLKVENVPFPLGAEELKAELELIEGV